MKLPRRKTALGRFLARVRRSTKPQPSPGLSSTALTTSHFDSLPPKLLAKVLNLVANEAQQSRIASYATVNKSWQSFFEVKTFQSLFIEQDDLENFERIVVNKRRQYVKHIWLRIDLHEATTTYKVPPRPSTTFLSKMGQLILPCQRLGHVWGPATEDCTFTMSICRLWRILSKWETRSGESSQGLTLELMADKPTPKTKLYPYKDYSATEKTDSYKEYLATGSIESYKSSKDVHSVYVNLYELDKNLGPIFTNWWRGVLNDLFGFRPLSLGYSKNHEVWHNGDYEIPQLPKVPVVTKFLTRKPQFREIHASALDKIIQSLPCVENISIERWRSPVLAREQHWCKDAAVPFGISLPPSIKTLSLYGETSYVFNSWSADMVNTMALANALQQYGKHLENLSVSHLIDAKDFFSAFWPTNSDSMTESLPEWHHLRTLSLTSEILTTDTKQDTNNLLCAAARAAKKMPNLQLLELWNGKKKQACVFRYRVAASVNAITWLGTHVDTPDRQVIEAWNKTSMARGRSDLRAFAIRLDCEEIISAGTVLRYLDLRSQIMHPVSGYRTAWEQLTGILNPDGSAEGL
ncbi:hypothetical protein NW762_001598 [Fusarium torreyae]|uniref:DUF6546 domain-containing protein n=1 Tax=Fusarium torreyae TaxID=1237075 RepID=A0A9W8SFY9_9HYPO|nr:hypothetical protein NW762_001598 [Fusarium torreyae]